MNVTYEIKNGSLFTKKVDDVDTSELSGSNNSFNTGHPLVQGHLRVVEKAGKKDGKQTYFDRCFSGDHGVNDYIAEYGFKLVISDGQR